MDCGGLARMTPFHSPDIFRKSHWSIPLNSEPFRNGSQKIGLGVNFYPLLAIWGLRAGWLSNGQCDFSTPHSSAPNEPIKMAFGTRDYVMETTPPANFYPPTLFSLPPGKGWNITYVSVPFFCLCFLRKAVCPHESADFYDLCVKRRHSVACCAFWGLELYSDPFGGRLPPKTSPKRPSKGKFKPKQKIRKIKPTFERADWSLPNFTILRFKITCIWRFSEKWKFSKSKMAAAAILNFKKS